MHFEFPLHFRAKMPGVVQKFPICGRRASTQVIAIVHTGITSSYWVAYYVIIQSHTVVRYVLLYSVAAIIFPKRGNELFITLLCRAEIICYSVHTHISHPIDVVRCGGARDRKKGERISPRNERRHTHIHIDKYTYIFSYRARSNSRNKNNDNRSSNDAAQYWAIYTVEENDVRRENVFLFLVLLFGALQMFEKQ